MKFRKGFTLIELLVVISIIALLVSILMPALSKARETARMTVCASNQRQLLLGVTEYSADNDGKFPRHVAHRADGSFSWPSYLNYYVDDTSRHGNLSTPRGSMFNAMGKYIEDVGVFLCPLGPPTNTNFEKIYKDPEPNDHTNASYNSWWGGFPMTMADGRKFIGPTSDTNKKGQAKLLISDMLSFWPGSGNLQWWISHRSKSATKQEVDPVFGNNTSMFWVETNAISANDPPDIKINAGFVDCHVSRYGKDEIIAGNGGFYIPQEWK
ncbi:MAG: type II secretion system protein [Phycisphaerae bacterium]|nr:type II secretion system protein [Phycisphaerae bacterium]